jgi:hypothetical protein
MEEWQRLGLSASISGCIGFLAGVLAEPVKVIIKHKHEVRRLRKRLFQELGYTYGRVADIVAAIEAHTYCSPLDEDYFWYNYAKQHLELAKDLDEWYWIEQVYGGFLYVTAACSLNSIATGEPTDEALWKARQSCKTVEGFMGVSSIGRMRPLLKYVPRHLHHRFRYRRFF